MPGISRQCLVPDRSREVKLRSVPGEARIVDFQAQQTPGRFNTGLQPLAHGRIWHFHVERHIAHDIPCGNPKPESVVG